jgi:hypothetical protein
MNQALYAHMNNKRKMKKKKRNQCVYTIHQRSCPTLVLTVVLIGIGIHFSAVSCLTIWVSKYLLPLTFCILYIIGT